VRLMTNNPEKVRQLEQYGVAVAERVPIEMSPRASNRDYLRTKRAKFGHLLSLVTDDGGRKAPASRAHGPGKKPKQR